MTQHLCVDTEGRTELIVRTEEAVGTTADGETKEETDRKTETKEVRNHFASTPAAPASQLADGILSEKHKMLFSEITYIFFNIACKAIQSD